MSAIMTCAQARESARDDPRNHPAGDAHRRRGAARGRRMPAPAHFGLLSILSVQPAQAHRPRVAAGRQPADDVRTRSARWPSAAGCARTAPEGDRRVGDDRGDRRPAARRSSASAAAPKRTWPTCSRRSIMPARRRLHGGLGVLRKVFAGAPASASRKGQQNTGEAQVVSILDGDEADDGADDDCRMATGMPGR